MKLKVAGIVVFTLILSISYHSKAQTNDVALSFNTEQKEQAFDHIVSIENSGVINGVEYLIPFNGFSTHPFFESNSGSVGEVIYDDQEYKGVSLLYDIFGDNLILRYLKPNRTYALIQFRKEKVSEFKILNRKFRRYNTIEKGGSTDGYYEVLFEGSEITLLARRLKDDEVKDRRVEYIPQSLLYIVHKGKWQSITSKSSVIKVSEKNEEAISEFIKTNHIKVPKKNEADLIRLATYMDETIKANP